MSTTNVSVSNLIRELETRIDMLSGVEVKANLDKTSFERLTTIINKYTKRAPKELTDNDISEFKKSDIEEILNIMEIKESEINKIIEEIIKKFNKIDFLINCAGILPKFSKFDKTNVDIIDEVMKVNFYSCVYSIKHMISILKKSTFPSIVNVSSSASLVTFAGISGYSASKSALKSFCTFGILRKNYPRQAVCSRL